MAEIHSFAAAQKAAKKNGSQKKSQKNTMCRNGHHRWVVDVSKKFDVKQGKLVTVYRCPHCQKIKTELL